MLSEQLRKVLEETINFKRFTKDPYGKEKRRKQGLESSYNDPRQKALRRQISKPIKNPQPDKGKYGEDVYATVDMQKAAQQKQMKKADVTPAERKMLLAASYNTIINDLEDIITDQIQPRRLPTARDREASQAKRMGAKLRTAIKNKERRKIAALS